MKRQRKSAAKTRIFLSCRRLLDVLISVTNNFPKSVKFTIGSRITDICIDMLLDITRAYTIPESRLKDLNTLISRYDVLKVLLTVAGENKWIQGNRKYAEIIEIMNEIECQAVAWRGSLDKGIDDRTLPESQGQGLASEQVI